MSEYGQGEPPGFNSLPRPQYEDETKTEEPATGGSTIGPEQWAKTTDDAKKYYEQLLSGMPINWEAIAYKGKNDQPTIEFNSDQIQALLETAGIQPGIITGIRNDRNDLVRDFGLAVIEKLKTIQRK